MITTTAGLTFEELCQNEKRRWAAADVSELRTQKTILDIVRRDPARADAMATLEQRIDRLEGSVAYWKSVGVI